MWQPKALVMARKRSANGPFVNRVIVDHIIGGQVISGQAIGGQVMIGQASDITFSAGPGFTAPRVASPNTVGGQDG